jgi:hypothetical protein
MSESAKPPERIAEILLEILALSNSAGTSQPESAHGNDSIELSSAECVKPQSQRRDEENNGQRP